jgi:hypothetical protein
VLRPPAKKKAAAKPRAASGSGSAAVAVTSSPPPPVEVSAPAPKVKLPKDSLPSVAAEPAELWLWELDNEQYIKYADVTARIVEQPGVPFAYYIIASTEDGDVLMHTVTSEMSERYSQKIMSFTWNNRSEREDSSSSWCFRFAGGEESFVNFMNAFTMAKWETVNKAPWGKIKEDEQQYVRRANVEEDVVMAEPEDDAEEEEDVANELDPDLGNCPYSAFRQQLLMSRYHRSKR